MEKFKQINVILVDDRMENLFALETLLLDKVQNINYVKCLSGHEALRKTLEMDVALILLDVQMPNMDGFEVARILRKNNKTKHIPIIFLTAISKEDQYVEQGYDMGGIDYLFKPVNPFILVAKIKWFIQLYQLQASLNESNSRLERFADLVSERIQDAIITIKICANDLKQNPQRPDHQKLVDLIGGSADKVQEAIKKLKEESRARG